MTVAPLQMVANINTLDTSDRSSNAPLEISR
jgi:hypothetical protein